MGCPVSLRRILLATVVLLVAAYGCDYLWVRYRMANPKAGNAFGSVTFYDSTTMKNGKTEVFYDQPLTQVCVHTIFPQLGDQPCWYASRRTVKSID
jgi:hypothetical protein